MFHNNLIFLACFVWFPISKYFLMHVIWGNHHSWTLTYCGQPLATTKACISELEGLSMIIPSFTDVTWVFKILVCSMYKKHGVVTGWLENLVEILLFAVAYTARRDQSLKTSLTLRYVFFCLTFSIIFI